MSSRKKYILSTCVLVVILILLSIGYAYLSSNLNINGSSSIKNASWDIYWDNVVVTSGSVSASTPVIDTNKTTVTYDITLTNPGDFYEFTVDVKNDGTIDAMIDSISFKLNNSEITSLPSYLNYSISYSDGSSILLKQELNAGTKETYKVRVEYKKDVTASDLPTSDQNLSLSFSVTYVQKDDTSIIVPHPESFETDSWDTIVEAVKSGNTDKYNIGDTKEIDLGDYGVHVLRVANKSTPAECSTTGFSQTACGFVLEFEDIVTKKRMNPYVSSATNNGNANIGGWEYSEIRTFLNSNFYNSLPSALKAGIIDTTVVSSHGSSDSNNFVTTDKIYLLSTHEVWNDKMPTGRPFFSHHDTGYDLTRQLDYYLLKNVYISFVSQEIVGNYGYAEKKYNGSFSDWWLRSSKKSDEKFIAVDASGLNVEYTASFITGISPAFRIG